MIRLFQGFAPKGDWNRNIVTTCLLSSKPKMVRLLTLQDVKYAATAGIRTLSPIPKSYLYSFSSCVLNVFIVIMFSS